MANQSIVQKAIIFSSRMDLREGIRDVLKKCQILKVEASVSPGDTLTFLQEDERALLVLDFNQGEGVIRNILMATRQTFPIEVRPILLFANEINPKLLALSQEFHIARFHTGEISKGAVQEIIVGLLEDEELIQPLRAVFGRVASKRATKDWDGASQILEELLKKYPDNEKIITELAENKIGQGKWAEARSLLEPMQNQDQPSVRALQLFGRCSMWLKDYENANLAFSRARIVNPSNVECLLALGDSFLHLNEIVKAKEAFDEAAALEPKSKRVIEGQGRCMLMQGDVNEALALMREVSTSRELASIFNSSAILSIRNGNYKEGMVLYDAAFTAVDADTRLQARLHFNKGIGFWRWQKEEDALACFEKAVKCDKKYKRAQDNYINLAQRLGKQIARGLGPAEEKARTRVKIRPPSSGGGAGSLSYGSMGKGAKKKKQDKDSASSEAQELEFDHDLEVSKKTS